MSSSGIILASIKDGLKNILRNCLEIWIKTGEIDQIEDRTIDKILLKTLRGIGEEKNEKIHIRFQNMIYVFSEPPTGSIGGRPPYDALVEVFIDGEKRATVFLNNKVGRLNSTARNDITTYHALLRLYLGSTSPRFTTITPEMKEVIRRRVSGEEVIGYCVFVVDTTLRENVDDAFNLFFLEELMDMYVNPRQDKFQVEYKPRLRKTPMSYCDFIKKFIDACIEALRRKIDVAEKEIRKLKDVLELIAKA